MKKIKYMVKIYKTKIYYNKGVIYLKIRLNKNLILED